MLKIFLETKTVALIPLFPPATSIIKIITTTKTVTEQKESPKLFTHPVRHVEKQCTAQRSANLEPMQPIDRLPVTGDRKDKISTQEEPTKVTLMKFLKLQPKI